MQPHTSLSLSQNLGCFNAIGETVLYDRYKDFMIHNQRILTICLGFLNSTCCQNMTTWTWLDVVQPTMQDPNCAHTRPKCPHLVFNRDQNCQFAGVSGKSAHWILGLPCKRFQIQVPLKPTGFTLQISFVSGLSKTVQCSLRNWVQLKFHTKVIAKNYLISPTTPKIPENKIIKSKFSKKKSFLKKVS